jgi:acetyl-CoA C-acetyltransferase
MSPTSEYLRLREAYLLFLGATGAVLTTRLCTRCQRDRLKRGMVTLCIGGGQAIALALERIA